jgi:hypothetical protein
MLWELLNLLLVHLSKHNELKMHLLSRQGILRQN